MKIPELKVPEYQGESFTITKHHGMATLDFGDGKIIENVDYYGPIILGDCECMTADLYEGLNTDSILIAGLGLGLTAKHAKTIYNHVDVIENNIELIDYITTKDILPSGVNVLISDVYNYTPTRNYDVILFDLWWHPDDITEEQKETLRNIYTDHLNEGGKMITPVAFSYL